MHSSATHDNTNHCNWRLSAQNIFTYVVGRFSVSNRISKNAMEKKRTNGKNETTTYNIIRDDEPRARRVVGKRGGGDEASFAGDIEMCCCCGQIDECLQNECANKWPTYMNNVKDTRVYYSLNGISPKYVRRIYTYMFSCRKDIYMFCACDCVCVCVFRMSMLL